MIQVWIMDQLKAQLPGLNWTVDWAGTKAHNGTVYYEGGAAPTRYDVEYRFPRYMVWIESTDWEYAEYAAQRVQEILDGLSADQITVEYLRNGQVIDTDLVRLHRLTAVGEPNPLGVEDDKRQFTVNVDAAITIMKEETQP